MPESGFSCSHRAVTRALHTSGGPDAAFLERFLAARGAGPHHFNFVVDDIGRHWPGSVPSASSPSGSTWPTHTGKRRSCSRE